MFGGKSPDVLVVGAGPVGLFAALGLARSGVRVRIVDRDWRTGAHSYALALHGDSLGLLGRLGLREQVLDRAYRVDTLALYDGSGHRAEVKLSAEEGSPGFVAAMRQDALEKMLEDELRRLGVKVAWNHEVAGLEAGEDHVTATVNKMVKQAVGYAVAHTEWIVARSEQLRVPLVIGADGHESLVRRSLGVDFAAAGPTEHYAVFELKSSADWNHEMRIVFDGGTTSVLWPLSDGHCRWSFQLADSSPRPAAREKQRVTAPLGAGRYPMLGEENLRTLLAERAPWFDAPIEEIRWQMVVPFERRVAGRFGSGRCWLAGDAGHTTGPAGMQSMNVGLREADCLAEIVAGMLREGESAEALEEYNRQRVGEWRFLAGLSGGLRPGPDTDPWIASVADRLLPCLPASGKELAALAGRLKLQVDFG